MASVRSQRNVAPSISRQLVNLLAPGHSPHIRSQYKYRTLFESSLRKMLGRCGVSPPGAGILVIVILSPKFKSNGTESLNGTVSHTRGVGGPTRRQHPTHGIRMRLGDLRSLHVLQRVSGVVQWQPQPGANLSRGIRLQIRRVHAGHISQRKIDQGSLAPNRDLESPSQATSSKIMENGFMLKLHSIPLLRQKHPILLHGLLDLEATVIVQKTQANHTGSLIVRDPSTEGKEDRQSICEAVQIRETRAHMRGQCPSYRTRCLGL